MPSDTMTIDVQGEPVMYEDRHGDKQRMYGAWEQGWPCRVVLDDNFIGRVTNPHSVV